MLDAHGRKLPAITDQLKLSLVFKNSKEHLLYAVATVNRPCSFSGNCSGMVATGRLGLCLVVNGVKRLYVNSLLLYSEIRCT